MKFDYVSIEKRDGVAIVRFDRKANLNAFNEKLVVELTHAAQGFFDDLETHVVVLTGAMAGVVLSMPQPTVRMIKEAVNATANALHGASAFADADQSQLTASSKSARGARESFRRK